LKKPFQFFLFSTGFFDYLKNFLVWGRVSLGTSTWDWELQLGIGNFNLGLGTSTWDWELQLGIGNFNLDAPLKVAPLKVAPLKVAPLKKRLKGSLSKF